MTLADQAAAAVTREALAAAARLCSEDCCVYANTPNAATGADLRDFQPVSAPEPTESVTEPQEAPREH